MKAHRTLINVITFLLASVALVFPLALGVLQILALDIATDTLSAVALGAEYRYSEDWTLRAGFQYDETPTTGQNRSTRTPDGNRTWLSGGETWMSTTSGTLGAAAMMGWLTVVLWLDRDAAGGGVVEAGVGHVVRAAQERGELTSVR